jgi:hypothetical protein
MWWWSTGGGWYDGIINDKSYDGMGSTTTNMKKRRVQTWRLLIRRLFL